MRIALVAPFGLKAKGTARARALPLGRALARRGHVVALFVPPYDSPEDSGHRWQEPAALSDPTGAYSAAHSSHSSGRSPTVPGAPDASRSRSEPLVDVINIVLPSGRGGVVWHLQSGWRLFLAVRAWRPDVIHIFKPKGPSGLVGALAWLTRRSPTHLVVDADDWEGPGGWNDDPRTGYSALQRRFFAWQERYGLSHADAWTVTSHCLRDRAISFGASPEHVHILHNGVPASSIFNLPSSIRNPQSPIPNPPSAILYTRFAGVQPAEVAEIWGQVRALRPDAMLTVLGRGVAGEERALVGVPGIVARGWVEPVELPAILGSARLAIVPWADTPSNRARHSAKVLELMAVGLPIVAYAVGELPETLGDAGLLIPTGDRDAFVRAVIALLDDPARAKALAAAAQARAQTVFNWDVLAGRALEAYGAV